MNDSSSALSMCGGNGGSGTYNFLALTSGTATAGGIQQPGNIYQNTLSSQYHHRRPNYSNEDLVDDLNRCSALHLHQDNHDDQDFEEDEDYQL